MALPELTNWGKMSCEGLYGMWLIVEGRGDTLCRKLAAEFSSYYVISSHNTVPST
jgi:hypothetical protein